MADFDSFTYTGAARRWDTDLNGDLETITTNNRVITDGKGTLIHGAYRSSWISNDDLSNAGPAITINVSEAGSQTDPAGGTAAWLFTKTTTGTGAAVYRRHTFNAADRGAFIVGILGDGVSNAVSIGISDDTGNGFLASNVRKIPFLGGAVGPGTLDGASGRVKVTNLSNTEWTFFYITTDAALTASTTYRFYVYPGGHDSTTVGHACTVYRPTLSQSNRLIGIDEIGSSGVDVPASLETRTLGAMARTLYVDFFTGIAEKAGFPDFVIASLDTGSGSDNNVLLTLSADLDTLTVRPRVGGNNSTTASLSSLSWNSDERHKVAFSITAEGVINLAADGNAISPVSSTSPAGCVRCNLGSDPVGGGALWGHVREAQGWSNTRTSAELITLTTA